MTNNETENREELNDKGTAAENELPVDETLANEDASADEDTQTQASIEGKLKAEIAELNDKYLRLYSEFDNMKRRNAKERIELMDTAGKDILLSFIPVVDDFERAQKAFENSTDVEAVKEGVTLIHTKFLNILSQKGVKAIESKGQPFDVDYHEAITKIPAPTDDLKGKVVDEVEKGYTLKDKVIRFAKVVIGE